MKIFTIRYQYAGETWSTVAIAKTAVKARAAFERINPHVLFLSIH